MTRPGLKFKPWQSLYLLSPYPLTAFRRWKRAGIPDMWNGRLSAPVDLIRQR